MMIRRFLLAAAIAAAVLSAGPPDSKAEFYQYLDKDGRRVFVDDIGKVPEAVRGNLKVYREKYDHLSDGERMLMLQQEEAAEAQRQSAEKEHRERQALKRYMERMQTPVVIRKNRVMLPVKLGYRGAETDALLVLDTGASITALHREVAERLYIEQYEEAKMRVFGGSVIDTRIALLDYLQVGPFRRENLHVAIIDHGGAQVEHQGLLGMDVLKDLEYTIDFEQSMVRWKPPRSVR